MPGALRTFVTESDATVRRDGPATRVALLAGSIFVVAGLLKFVAHGWELRAFRRFDLPAPALFVILAGVIEMAGGALLLARRAIVPAALLLAATMAVATVVSGVIAGDVIPSLTLAPALLVAMIVLVARGVRPQLR